MSAQQASNVDIERLDAQMTDLLEYVYSSPEKEISIALAVFIQEYTHYSPTNSHLHPKDTCS